MNKCTILRDDVALIHEATQPKYYIKIVCIQFFPRKIPHDILKKYYKNALAVVLT